MKFNTSLTLALLSLSGITAFPTLTGISANIVHTLKRGLETTGSPVKGEGHAAYTFSFYACVHANWQGECKHFVFTGGNHACYTFGANDLPEGISSIGADKGFGCALHTDAICRSVALQINFPGFPDLSDALGGGEFNDRGRSVRCWMN